MSAFHEAQWKELCASGAVVAATLLLTPLWPVDVAAQNAVGSCIVNRATYRAVTEGGGSTNSTTFVSIPDTQLNFTVGGADPTCVIVFFTAQTQTTDDENMIVRARIVGFATGVPTELSLGPGTGTTEARPAQFVFENVFPGDYTVRMQYRSVTGSTVTLTRPTVVVHHR